MDLFVVLFERQSAGHFNVGKLFNELLQLVKLLGLAKVSTLSQQLCVGTRLKKRFLHRSA